MEQNRYDISYLVVSYLNNELTSEEHGFLEIWLSDPKNKKLFTKLVDKENLLAKSFEYDNDDPNLAWKQISSRINKPFNFRTIIKYAAAILLPLLVTFTFYHHNKAEKAEAIQNTEIKAGEKNAVVYLYDGQVINLKEDTSGLISSKDSLLLQKDNNTLRISDEHLAAGAATKMNKIVTPIGSEFQLVLSDGTKVWLNADSKLEFPAKFSDKERRVLVSGELYFEVTHSNVPFIVESKYSKLKVLGTQFNIRAYQDENNTISTLIKGSVEVSNNEGKKIRLTPGNEVHITTKDGQMHQQTADIESVIAWKNGRFSYDNQNIKRIMGDLARWYKVDVSYRDSKIIQKRFSVNVPRYKNMDKILKLMEGTGDVNFEINNNNILIK